MSDYPEVLQSILDRIPAKWGKWISCGPGWFPLLAELDQKLAEIDPDYVVHQCKEKFGGLRYYHEPSPGLDAGGIAAMEALVDAAEERSWLVDEITGKPKERT